MPAHVSSSETQEKRRPHDNREKLEGRGHSPEMPGAPEAERDRRILP